MAAYRSPFHSTAAEQGLKVRIEVLGHPLQDAREALFCIRRRKFTDGRSCLRADPDSAIGLEEQGKDLSWWGCVHRLCGNCGSGCTHNLRDALVSTVRPNVGAKRLPTVCHQAREADDCTSGCAGLVARRWQSGLSDGLGLHARCSARGAQEQEGRCMLRLAPCARPLETYGDEAWNEVLSMHNSW